MTSGAIPAPPRTRPLRTLLLGAGGFAAFVVLSGEDGPVLCPFRRCTGLECAGCGMTRSAGRLLQGDLSGGFARHPLGPLVLAQLAVVLLLFLVRPERVRMRWVLPLVIANGVLLTAVWVARLVTGDIGPGLG